MESLKGSCNGFLGTREEGKERRHWRLKVAYRMHICKDNVPEGMGESKSSEEGCRKDPGVIRRWQATLKAKRVADMGRQWSYITAAPPV